MRDPLETCHPIGIEIHKVDKALLEGWKQPERSPYAEFHGLKLNSVDWEARKKRLPDCAC